MSEPHTALFTKMRAKTGKLWWRHDVACCFTAAGSRRSMPFGMYGRRTSGIVTLPSSHEKIPRTLVSKEPMQRQQMVSPYHTSIGAIRVKVPQKDGFLSNSMTNERWTSFRTRGRRGEVRIRRLKVSPFVGND